MLTAHQTLGRGLRDLIGLQVDLTVAGEASTVAEARQALARRDADLVLVDRLALAGAAARPRDLFPERPSIPVLVMTMDNELAYVKRGLIDGIRGFVTKHDLALELIAALRAALEGRRYLSHEPLVGIPEEEQVRMLTGGAPE